MKRCLLLAVCIFALSPFALAVDREVIKLQQDVALLQGMVRELQRGFDEKMAVMQTLQNQTVDKVNQINQASAQGSSQLSTNLAELQRSLQTSNANTGGKVDTMNSEIQGLQSSLDELRARLDKVSDQIAKLASSQQNISPSGAIPGGMGTNSGGNGFPPSGGSGFPPSGGSGFPPTGGSFPAFPDQGGGGSQPAPDVLYNSALRDYTGGNYPLALQEFTDYLRYFPNTILASNAQFYIGDVYYQQGQFNKAIQEYDKAVEQYPNGNKTAAAQLKKGYAYLNMDMRVKGTTELNNLIKRFPSTPEAALAKDKLSSLGTGRAGASPRRRPGN